MKIFTTLLLLAAVQVNSEALAAQADCFKDFRVCYFWREVATGAIINQDDLPANFVELMADGEPFILYCFGRSTGLVNKVTHGLATDGKLCGETYAALFGDESQPCGYVCWNSNSSVCVEP